LTACSSAAEVLRGLSCLGRPVAVCCLISTISTSNNEEEEEEGVEEEEEEVEEEEEEEAEEQEEEVSVGGVREVISNPPVTGGSVGDADQVLEVSTGRSVPGIVGPGEGGGLAVLKGPEMPGRKV
jgi:hypothetical protein